VTISSRPSVRRLALFTLNLICLSAGPVLAESFRTAFPAVWENVDDETRSILNGIEVETGSVTLGTSGASLTLPEGYYFIDAKGSKLVLEDLWGNPPDIPPLGMIFPHDASPLHDTWGATVEFDPLGYVSDEDAADMDFTALLKDMQADTLAANPELSKLGYPQVTLIGWAEPPHYDRTARELYWAKELHFEGSDDNILNYNIRELGRRGVMVINFIASMQQLDEVRSVVPDVLKMVEFSEGHRYADFVPGTDTVAALGVGGLIAGKVLSKAGLLAILAVVLKKGGFLIFLPLIWLFNWFRGRRSGT